MLNVGDTVQVKSSYGYDEDPGGCYFVDDMAHFLGSYVTILNVTERNRQVRYKVENDPSCWLFTEDMFTAQSLAALQHTPAHERSLKEEVEMLKAIVKTLQEEVNLLKEKDQPRLVGGIRKVVNLSEVK